MTTHRRYCWGETLWNPWIVLRATPRTVWIRGVVRQVSLSLYERRYLGCAYLELEFTRLGYFDVRSGGYDRLIVCVWRKNKREKKKKNKITGRVGCRFRVSPTICDDWCVGASRLVQSSHTVDIIFS